MKPAAESSDAPDLEVEPEVATKVFGDRIEVARRYIEHLRTTGVDHGLIGPREIPRLWTRHVLNCAVVAELIPDGARVLDVGSGAGLPGIALAVVRPDLEVVLVEPLERRCRWLGLVIQELDLADQVSVLRSRAQDVPGEAAGDVVTSRAVAALPKLLKWCLPLATPGGLILAMKGERAEDELAATESDLRAWGVDNSRIEVCGVGTLAEPVRVVTVVFPDQVSVLPPHARRTSGRSKGSAGPRSRGTSTATGSERRDGGQSRSRQHKAGRRSAG